jgi:hypothetical protein
MLEGDPDLTSIRQITPKAKEAFQLFDSSLDQLILTKWDPDKEVLFQILPTKDLPTGALFQDPKILEFIRHLTTLNA